MARRSSILLILSGLTPALAACAVAGDSPAPVRVAYANVPPMPAELLAPTNGKAEAPFQVDTRVAVALLARRAASPAPVAVASAQPATAPVSSPPVHLAAAGPQAARKASAVRVAKAAQPVRATAAAPSLLMAKAPVAASPVFTAKPVVETAAFAPAKPLPYAEFVRADIVLNAATPLVRPVAVASVKSSAVSKRRLRVIATEAKTPGTTQTAHMASAAPSSPATAVWLVPRPATRQARVDRPVMTRIDAMIRSWFARVRS